MKKMLVVLSLMLLPAVAWAEEPPYFVDPVKGYYLPDLVQRGTFTLQPGALDQCVLHVAQPDYSIFQCGLIGTEIEITLGAKAVKVGFKSLHVTEYSTKAGSSLLNYNFIGLFSEVLPDGTLYETNANMYFERKSDTPERLTGRLGISSVYSGGALVATVKP